MSDINEYNLDPATLEIFKTLLQNQSLAAPSVPGPTSPETPETGILQRLKERILGPMAGGLGRALGAGVPAIPAYRLYQQLIGQPFREYVGNPIQSDIRYVLTGQGQEGQVPSPDYVETALTPPPTPTSKTTPKKVTPKITSTGEQVGTPQYSAPPITTSSPTLPETPAVSGAITPAETVPTSAAQMPDFSKLVQPWKPKTDYEKELMDIFDKAVPQWKDLPQGKSVDPTTPTGVLSRFARDVGLSLLHKDIFALKEGEIAKEEAKAAQERNYVIQRSSQLANFKLSALDQKMKKEETDRESSAKWLEYVGNANPEYRKNSSYQAAVASIRGIPSDQAAPLLQSMTDPTTGKLEGMYERPEERMVKQQEALNNWSIDKLVKAGFTKDRAAFSLATGSMDMGAFLMNRYQNAVTAGDKVTAIQARKDISEYQKIMTFDPMEEKATSFLKNSDIIKKSGLFSDNESFNFMKNWATTYMLLGKDAAKELKMPTENVKLNENVAKLAVSALGNPAGEKAFFDKFGMTAQSAFQIHYGIKEGQPPSLDMPEPFYTATKMFPTAAKSPEKFMGMDAIGESVKTAAKDQIVLRYKPLFMEIGGEGISQTPQTQSIRKVMQKKPLTDDEIYRIATVANQGNQTALGEVVRQIYTARGIKLNP